MKKYALLIETDAEHPLCSELELETVVDELQNLGFVEVLGTQEVDDEGLSLSVTFTLEAREIDVPPIVAKHLGIRAA